MFSPPQKNPDRTSDQEPPAQINDDRDGPERQFGHLRPRPYKQQKMEWVEYKKHHREEDACGREAGTMLASRAEGQRSGDGQGNGNGHTNRDNSEGEFCASLHQFFLNV